MMPDESSRIRRTAIYSMGSVMLSLNSFCPETDPTKHPRICIIFNNVSKYPKEKKFIIKYGENPVKKEKSSKKQLRY